MNGANTGYFIVYGGILLFVSVICVIDSIDRRRERREQPVATTPKLARPMPADQWRAPRQALDPTRRIGTRPVARQNGSARAWAG